LRAFVKQITSLKIIPTLSKLLKAKMNNEFKNQDKLRKQKAKENVTPDQRDACLA
ncbi:8089_t:CDS:1, partial [Racocetra persica]